MGQQGVSSGGLLINLVVDTGGENISQEGYKITK
jgi:hypothetical protein